MASTSILIVDQREATQRTLKLTCKTTLTAAKLKRTYGKHTGEDRLSPYSVAPPSRRELAESFTGPELAEQLRVGSVLAVRPRHSAHLEAIGGAAAFVRSLYLITNVEKDDGSLTLELRTNSEAEALRKRLDAAGDAVLDNGRRFTLAEIRRGSGVVAGRDCLWALRTRGARGRGPARRRGPHGPGGEDHLAAVNLNARIVRRTARRGVELRHRVGGVAARVVGLRDYEGEVGVACGFADGRWRVRFRDGSLKAARPEHVEPGRKGRSRSRGGTGATRAGPRARFGEIGRGHWGVAACCVADVVDDDRYETAARSSRRGPRYGSGA
ncbi:hypothetical protein JL720_5537 [Aureococcus anophagefferens]|nr:hypothetical protein JL720_5537 [Aureococcus anophagefferens]